MRRAMTILLLVALSLPPAIAGAASVRSRFVHDSVAFEVGRKTYIIMSVGGLLGGFQTSKTYASMHGRMHWGRYEVTGHSMLESASRDPATRHFLGAFFLDSSIVPESQKWFAIRYWHLALLLSLPPTLLIARLLRRRRRVVRGLCTHCGYDLRASPDRCPECGLAAGASPVAA